jgi:hypothetical protein
LVHPFLTWQKIVPPSHHQYGPCSLYLLSPLCFDITSLKSTIIITSAPLLKSSIYISSSRLTRRILTKLSQEFILG